MKVVFFVYEEWCFGAIHHGLERELHKYGIQGTLISWNKTYDRKYFDHLNKIYDVFVTVPSESIHILHGGYGIPKDKIVLTFHGSYEVYWCVENKIDLREFKSIGAVCPDLVTLIKQLYKDIDVKLLQNGIVFDDFYQKPSEKLNVLGYAGTMNSVNKYVSKNCWKRRHLIEGGAKDANITLKDCRDRFPFIAMPSVYSEFDAVAVASTEIETCGMPIMEAAACGRVPLTTNVGIVKHLGKSPGIVLPMEPELYIKELSENLTKLSNDPNLHYRMCREAQDFAKEYYDWPKVIHDWIDLFQS